MKQEVCRLQQLLGELTAPCSPSLFDVFPCNPLSKQFWWIPSVNSIPRGLHCMSFGHSGRKAIRYFVMCEADQKSRVNSLSGSSNSPSIAAFKGLRKIQNNANWVFLHSGSTSFSFFVLDNYLNCTSVWILNLFHVEDLMQVISGFCIKKQTNKHILFFTMNLK